MKRRRSQIHRSFQLEVLESRQLLNADLTGPLAPFSALQLNSSQYDPSHILVRFRTDAPMASEPGTPLDLVPGLREVSLAPGTSVEQAIESFQSDPLVLYAQPDYRVGLTGVVTPNDPSYTSGSQWDLNNTGQNGGTTGADISAPRPGGAPPAPAARSSR